MFTINKENNRIEKISEKSFADLGFHERANLQEWLANNPEALGEELLIIQKEFDGFNDTRERLDLLALDKQGNLVVIENKLDDSGRDVTWQVLKYASYCSSLKKSQIIKIYQQYLSQTGSEKTAEELLIDFFEGNEIEEIQLNKGLTQRIMMVAGNFRKEVTSTVLWLMNYNIRMQCFKVTPYQMGQQLLLNFEQIIPMQEAEDFTINMAEKTQEDAIQQEELKSRHLIRIEFWKRLLSEMNKRTSLFSNINPVKSNSLGAGIGIGGFSLHFTISKNVSRCQVYIDKPEKEYNKQAFDILYAQKNKLEEQFGHNLKWERLDNYRASLIRFETEDFNVFQKEDWDDLVIFLADGMINMEKTFIEPIKQVQKKLKSTT